MYDTTNTGFVTKTELIASCAGLGVILPESELQPVASLMSTDSEGKIDYAHFLNLFSAPGPYLTQNSACLSPTSKLSPTKSTVK